MKYQAQLFAEQQITVFEIVYFPQRQTELANHVASCNMMLTAMKYSVGQTSKSIAVTDCGKNICSNQARPCKKTSKQTKPTKIYEVRSDTKYKTN